MDDAFDPYRKWLGIRTPERPLNHYQLLGLEPFEDDAETISHAADQRISYVRTLAVSDYADLTQRVLNELAAAKVTLLNPDKKPSYDEQLRARPAAAAPPPVRPPPRPPTAPQPPPVSSPLSRTGVSTSPSAVARMPSALGEFTIQPIGRGIAQASQVPTPEVRPSPAAPRRARPNTVSRRVLPFTAVACFLGVTVVVAVIVFAIGFRVARTMDSKASAPAPAAAASSPTHSSGADGGSSSNAPPLPPGGAHANVPLVGTNKFKEPVELTVDGKSLGVGQPAATRLVDWDADGKLDLLVGVGDGYVWLFRNVGTRTDFRLAPGEHVRDGQADLRAGTKAAVPFRPGTSCTTACFVDMTGDGKADLVVAHSIDQLRLYVNQGTAAAPAFNGFTTIPGPNGNEFRLLSDCDARIDLADWDGDTRPDILAGNYGGTIVLYPNTGSPKSPVFELPGVPLRYQGDHGAPFKNPYNVHPAAFDLNQDGRLDVAYGINWGFFDLFISDPQTQSQSNFAFRHRVLTTNLSGSRLNVRDIAGDNTTPTFGDVNGDGTLDMVSGGLKGKLWLMLGVPNGGWDPSDGASKRAGD